MPAYVGTGIYGNAVGVTTPLAFKLSLAAGLTKTTTPLVIRPGLFYAGNANIIGGTGGMAYSVIAFEGATQRSASAGAVLGGNDGTIASLATTAAPGSNSRIDIVYWWNREFTLDGVDSVPVIGVVQGTAAAVPVAPSLAAFPGAIEIGRATVAAGAVATNGAGVTITQTSPFTSSDSGKVPFRNTTEMNLWTTALTDQLALDLSSQITLRWNGSAWAAVVGGGTVPITATTLLGAGGTRAIDADGAISFSGAVTSVGATLGTVAALAVFKKIVAVIEYQGSTAGSHTWQLALAGTPNATASSYLTKAFTDSGTQTLATGTSFTHGYTGSRRNRTRTIELFRLANAEKTRFVDGGVDDDDGASIVQMIQSVGNHTQTVAYDGVLFTLTGLATLSGGRIRFYGHI